MKVILLSILITAVSFTVIVTGLSLDVGIEKVSQDLASKIVSKGRSKIALLDFTTENGKTNQLTKYIQERAEINLINSPGLQVLDRSHIKLLLSEHRLQSDGLIDESTAKSAISFIKVDGWVIGEVTYIGNETRIKLKIIDVNNSQIFGAALSEAITDPKVAQILAPKPCTDCAGSGTILSKTKCNACGGNGGPSCYSCGGAGNVANGLGGKKEACWACAGKGKIVCSVCKGTGQATEEISCRKCKGTGKLFE